MNSKNEGLTSMNCENDDYEEVIVDPETGETVHEWKEKLGNHRGHGSAKKK